MKDYFYQVEGVKVLGGAKKVIVFFLNINHVEIEYPKGFPLVKANGMLFIGYSGYTAARRGSGAVAQGPGAVAVGSGGVFVGGNVSGPIVTGRRNRINNVEMEVESVEEEIVLKIPIGVNVSFIPGSEIEILWS